MSLPSKIREFFRVIGETASLLPALNYRMAADDEKVSLGSIFEDTVSRFQDNTMLILENRQWTDSEVNRFAWVLISNGITRGDAVALFMENRAEYVLAMLAVVKLGASYLWFSDKGQADKPAWAIDARVEMAGVSSHNLKVTSEFTAGETALYIFTSGMTGLPKAAAVLHRKILAAGYGIGRIGFRIKPEDRRSLCLPIYHITGMGELCRYLLMQPECSQERNNPLEKMLGNCLRPDVWDEFKTWFGVSGICEIYVSSEGNVSFLNLLNKDKTIGAAGSKVALVSYDNENDEIMRDATGRRIEVPVGDSGLLLGEISEKYKFDGYTDTSATEKKIVRDVLGRRTAGSILATWCASSTWQMSTAWRFKALRMGEYGRFRARARYRTRPGGICPTGRCRATCLCPSGIFASPAAYGHHWNLQAAQG
tara:strand:- start:1654 stop:2925 length:1272 start_codon:yes stop_codon:yes gene_type:complete